MDFFHQFSINLYQSIAYHSLIIVSISVVLSLSYVLIRVCKKLCSVRCLVGCVFMWWRWWCAMHYPEPVFSSHFPNILWTRVFSFIVMISMVEGGLPFVAKKAMKLVALLKINSKESRWWYLFNLNEQREYFILKQALHEQTDTSTSTEKDTDTTHAQNTRTYIARHTQIDIQG